MGRNYLPNRGLHLLTVLLLAQSSLSPALAEEVPLFFADREKLVQVAIAAVHEEHPDIAPDDLTLEKSIHLRCNILDEQSRIAPPVPESLAPCMAQFYLIRESTRNEVRFRDPEYGCMEAHRTEVIGVKIEQDGVALVGTRGWSIGHGGADDCGDELEELPLCYENPLWNPDSCE